MALRSEFDLVSRTPPLRRVEVCTRAASDPSACPRAVRPDPEAVIADSALKTVPLTATLADRRNETAAGRVTGIACRPMTHKLRGAVTERGERPIRGPSGPGADSRGTARGPDSERTGPPGPPRTAKWPPNKTVMALQTSAIKPAAGHMPRRPINTAQHSDRMAQ